MITEQQKNIHSNHSCAGVSFEDFVRKANEIYFDLEPEMYDKKHPEIKKFEAERWDNLAKKYFTKNYPLKVLDIGSGAGFVADRVCPILKKEDVFVFADISKKMLDYCQSIFRNRFKCELEFKNIDSGPLDFPDNYFDIVTMNSVLHHIPDTKKILQEVSRVLKNGGLLIIAHEVNKAFFKHKIIWTNYRIYRLLKNRRALFESLCNHFGLIGLYKRMFKSANVGDYDELLEKVNEELINQNIIKKPLSPSKMGLVMETYSSIGFDIDDLAKDTDLVLKEKKTYNHLSDDQMVWIFKLYNKMLKALFPAAGKNFVAVFQKYLNNYGKKN